VRYSVILTAEAEEDLRRIEEFLIELARKHGDYNLPERAMNAITDEMRILKTNPYTCRKAGEYTFERELIIPFGGSGFVALFEVISENEVAVMAVRHQTEEDYH
jgi:plasmid stabilization system protein ParE